MAYLDAVAQAERLDATRPPVGLSLREGDPERVDAVFAGRVHDEPAPATPHVEQAHPWTQAELAAHQVDLLRLRLLERGVRAGEDRAGVGHRRAEDEFVEAVAHVVVVGDGGGVAGLAVPHAPSPPALHFLRGRRQRAQHPRADRGEQVAQPRRALGPAALTAGLPDRLQGLIVVAAEVEVAVDVGPGQAQLARRADGMAQRPGRAQSQQHPRARNTRFGTVPGLQPHAVRPADEHPKGICDATPVGAGGRLRLVSSRAGSGFAGFGDRHQRLLTVLSYRSSNRRSGSYRSLSAAYCVPP